MENQFPIPDAVYLIDTEPAVSMRRIAHRGDVPNQFEKVEDLSQARDIFISIDSPNIHRIDGHSAVSVIHGAIIEHLTGGPIKTKFCAKSYGCHDEYHCSFRLSGTCRWFNLATKLVVGLNQPSRRF
jgi:hypothetical protein